MDRPWNHPRRRKTACCRRIALTAHVNARRSSSTCSQSTQEISLSWQYALLLPCCVRPISSPCRSIGTPCDRNKVARLLRCCRRRSASTFGSPVGPSTPLFHERLSSEPSRLSSRFFSLCLSLYDTRSVSVKPSWHVTKLIDAL